MAVVDEQDVKRPTQFLRYESGDNGNQLMIKSKLYKIDSHFLNSVKASVLCRGDECMYCQAGYDKRSEFNYFVYLNGELGYIDIKSSVFFAVQAIAKAQKRDVREISWTVIKKGEGLKTVYTVSKDDNLASEDFEQVENKLEENTDKLTTLMEKREEQLDQAYVDHMKDIRKQEQPKVAVKAKNEVKEVLPEQDDEPDMEGETESNEETVEPSEIPF